MSSVLPPTKVNQVSVPEKSQIRRVLTCTVRLSNLVEVLRRDRNISVCYNNPLSDTSAPTVTLVPSPASSIDTFPDTF